MTLLSSPLEHVGWESVLAVMLENTGLLAEPSLAAPSLQVQPASTGEIFLVEERFHLPVPFGEMVDLLCRRGGGCGCFPFAKRRGKHGELPNVDSVEVLEAGTPREESSQVDDAEASSVNPPVVQPTALVGAAVLLGSLRPGHVHGDLS